MVFNYLRRTGRLPVFNIFTAHEKNNFFETVSCSPKKGLVNEYYYGKNNIRLRLVVLRQNISLLEVNCNYCQRPVHIRFNILMQPVGRLLLEKVDRLLVISHLPVNVS